MAKAEEERILNQNLQNEYNSLLPSAKRFIDVLTDQFHHLLPDQHIVLGVPMECRVKTWESIAEKINRKELILNTITDLDDLIGIRLILLFKRDLSGLKKIINDNFKVTRYENTGDRLSETQFGYQSIHYVINVPDEWLKVPSFRDLNKFKAEIQVRTLAQHIWAAASHELQYKQETNVPSPIKRSINRVSAILELIDLEFERLLIERDSYLNKLNTSPENAVLNVDLIRAVLDEILPKENKIQPEDYASLIKDLVEFGVIDVKALRELIKLKMANIIATDKLQVEHILKNKNMYPPSIVERANKGVYNTHVGLVRLGIIEQFGEEKFEDYWLAKYRGEELKRTKTLSINPTNGATGVDINPTFAWPAVAGNGVTYEFVIAEELGNADKFAIIDYSATASTNAHKLRQSLKYGTQYWWRVRAVTATSKSDWTASFFTTKTQPKNLNTY